MPPAISWREHKNIEQVYTAHAPKSVEYALKQVLHDLHSDEMIVAEN
jgi:hypothetical protein